jgi:hypothetical protein
MVQGEDQRRREIGHFEPSLDRIAASRVTIVSKLGRRAASPFQQSFISSAYPVGARPHVFNSAGRCPSETAVTSLSAKAMPSSLISLHGSHWNQISQSTIAKLERMCRNTET